ncbi:FixH family protein [Paucibacter sediminis]|uniref:FixH family protein n=1 Tax=Paucibacter sediminis TaxID=3019553 RepID=A0AA95NMI8_9BURK|nr:FixH family protein [Paucibacter sp. S2-9]WIT14206.1 FixH family protein [Paucibacter sp. S2-9]
MSRSSLSFALVAAASTALAGLLTACGTPPADLDLSLQHPSVQRRFVVAMEPPAQGPAVGQMHAWRLKLATAEGQPVSQARISIAGGMPQHGHGLPTQPRVTKEPILGTYVIEGMKFSMTGWWDLRLDIDAAGARDQAVFNLVMTDAGLQR